MSGEKYGTCQSSVSGNRNIMTMQIFTELLVSSVM